MRSANVEFKFHPFPVITTERLVLRRLVATDAPLIHQLRSDPEVNRYLGRAISTGIDDALAYINKIDDNTINNRSMYWVITLKPNDELVGTICLWNFNTERETIEIGYELLPHQQGKGIMSEAVAAVIDYGFDGINAKAITGYPSANNLRSVAMLQKFGFTVDEELMRDEETITYNLLAFSLPTRK